MSKCTVIDILADQIRLQIITKVKVARKVLAYEVTDAVNKE